MDEFQKYRELLIEQCELHQEVFSGPDVKLTRYFYKADILEKVLDMAAHSPKTWDSSKLRDLNNAFDAFKTALRREVERKHDPYFTKLNIVFSGQFGQIFSASILEMIRLARANNH